MSGLYYFDCSTKGSGMKKFIAKALTNCSEAEYRRADWSEAKRCLLRIDSDSLSIGKSRLSYEEVTCGTVTIIPSALFISNAVLSLALKSGRFHHFELTYDPYLQEVFPFTVDVKQGRAPLLWIRRGVLIAMVLWLVWIFLFLR